MALNFNTASAAPSANASWEKAAGFINLSLPTPNGGTTKLGAISLKLSSKEEAKLFAACNASPEAAKQIMANILAKLVLEFRSAEKAEGTGFDIY